MNYFEKIVDFFEVMLYDGIVRKIRNEVKKKFKKVLKKVLTF